MPILTSGSTQNIYVDLRLLLALSKAHTYALKVEKLA